MINIDEEYMDYIARFDQFGEYTFAEEPEAEGDEDQVPKIHDPVKSKYEEEIYTLVHSIINPGIN